MTHGVLVPDRSLVDLIPRTSSFGAGAFQLDDGAQLRYMVFPEEPDHYAVLTRDDGKGGVQRYVASREAFDSVAAERPSLRKGEYLHAFTGVAASASRAADDGEAELREKLRGHDPAEENALQTEKEASLQKDDVPLVRQIQQMYDTGAWASFLKQKDVGQLISVIKVPDMGDDDKIKWRIVVATTYMGVGDSLIPEITIFDDDRLYVCSREKVDNATVKKFMYENVQKSTKISAGIGLSMGSGSVAIKPKPGDPAFVKGKQPKAAGQTSGPGLTFSGEMVKTYARLTIQASMRTVVGIGKYSIAAFPRKSS